MDKMQEENEEIRKELQEARETNEMVMKRMDELNDKQKKGERIQRDTLRTQEQEETSELSRCRALMEKMRERLDKLERKMEERDDQLVRKVKEEVLDELYEREEREKRKKNVIMFNVEESNKEGAKEREQDDKKVCEHIFKDKLCVEDVDVVKVFRLGQRVNGRDRPLVAYLSEVHVKWEIIKKGNDLRQMRGDDLNKVRIGVDRTKREREQDAILREKLQEKRREGGRWIIKNRKVICLTGDEDHE